MADKVQVESLGRWAKDMIGKLARMRQLVSESGIKGRGLACYRLQWAERFVQQASEVIRPAVHQARVEMEAEDSRELFADEWDEEE